MSAPPAAPARRGLAVLFAVVIVDLVGFGVVMPVLPFWALEFGADAGSFGLLASSYAAAQFVFAPLWGRLSDRVGRRPVLLGTIAGTALAMLAVGLAPSLAWLFAARILAGAFAANVSVASAYIADVTPPEERTRWMGMLGASFGIGFVLGPAHRRPALSLRPRRPDVLHGGPRRAQLAARAHPACASPSGTIAARATPGDSRRCATRWCGASCSRTSPSRSP